MKDFPMNRYPLFLYGMLAASVAFGAAAYDTHDGQSLASAADRVAISQVVDNYAKYMTDGNEQGFESLFLDKDVAFSAVSAHGTVTSSSALRNYEKFRKAVFASGYKYRQVVSNVKIDEMGPLAQVSLTFTATRMDGKGQSATGWKILQLVKSNGSWKIASELYTFDIS
jgi:hypothetical protein